MNPTYSLIEGPYLRDLLGQPEAVWETAQHLASLDLRDLPGQLGYGAFDRMVLTGMGSSYHVLQLAPPALASTGIPVFSVETAELIHAQSSLLTSRTLLIAVSQSGRSAEMLRLLACLPAGCHLVSITNNAECRLIQRADTQILTCAGPEKTVACKTYVAAAAALIWLNQVLQGADPRSTAERIADTADALADYLSWWRDHTEALADLLSPARQVFVLGRGPSLAAAMSGALIIKEAARHPAEAMSSAAFRHGPIEALDEATALFILEGTAPLATLNRNFHDELSAQGTRSYLIDRRNPSAALRLPNIDDTHLPLVEILPLQMISLALAALAGLEAGHFHRATKITEVE